MCGDGLYDLAALMFWSRHIRHWDGVDVGAAIRADLRSRGEYGRDTERRLRCYLIHIGMDAQAYSAHIGRPGEVERYARQTLAYVRG